MAEKSYPLAGPSPPAQGFGSGQVPEGVRFRAVVIDLFDTLVNWNPGGLPVVQWRGSERRSTAPLLFPALEAALGERFSADAFMEAHDAVYAEIFGARAGEAPVEVTCLERFSRTLERLGIDGAGVAGLAGRLRLIHMGRIREVTTAPPQRVEAMKKIAWRFRLGLVSNFDDSETGHQIVRDTGLYDLFEAIIISADAGLRKPHPAIFRKAAEAMRLDPASIIYVGDTPYDDILGAKRAGMGSAWVRRGDRDLPGGVPKPDWVIGDLAELPEKLGL